MLSSGESLGVNVGQLYSSAPLCLSVGQSLLVSTVIYNNINYINLSKELYNSAQGEDSVES